MKTSLVPGTCNGHPACFTGHDMRALHASCHVMRFLLQARALRTVCGRQLSQIYSLTTWASQPAEPRRVSPPPALEHPNRRRHCRGPSLFLTRIFIQPPSKRKAHLLDPHAEQLIHCRQPQGAESAACSAEFRQAQRLAAGSVAPTTSVGMIRRALRVRQAQQLRGDAAQEGCGGRWLQRT